MEDDPYRKPLLLRGARQVRKTYAVRRLGQKFKYFVEVNFEQLRDAVSIFDKDLVAERLARDLSLLIRTPIIPGETLLFFDEVQEAPQSILAFLNQAI
jgi:MoxR-like ATPase